jgi:hypothetical protein
VQLIFKAFRVARSTRVREPLDTCFELVTPWLHHDLTDVFSTGNIVIHNYTDPVCEFCYEPILFLLKAEPHLTPKMVKTLAKMPETVKTLTNDLKKLTVKFDRASYKAAYDKVYFKRTAKCPNCGEIKVRHMLKRHLKTARCRRVHKHTHKSTQCS